MPKKSRLKNLEIKDVIRLYFYLQVNYFYLFVCQFQSFTHLIRL